mmetsp:Transcript_28315/g.71865  ORF Transcript_28315/g.71865 Transcript_28315/m.71865 type:complete len:210 (+) Transcript_28315:279-908(+)
MGLFRLVRTTGGGVARRRGAGRRLRHGIGPRHLVLALAHRSFPVVVVASGCCRGGRFRTRRGCDIRLPLALCCVLPRILAEPQNSVAAVSAVAGKQHVLVQDHEQGSGRPELRTRKERLLQNRSRVAVVPHENLQHAIVHRIKVTTSFTTPWNFSTSFFYPPISYGLGVRLVALKVQHHRGQKVHQRGRGRVRCCWLLRLWCWPLLLWC